MKTLILIAALFSLSFHAQSMNEFTIPKGYQKIAEAKGDLDKDGKDETVLVFNTPVKSSSKMDMNNGVIRVMYIIRDSNGKSQIWKENKTLIFSSGTGFYPEGNTLTIAIRNSSLIIEQEFSTNSRHTQNYRHIFRFQNGDFYLIGSKDEFADTCDFNFMNEINFSTGKIIIDKTFSSCDDDSKVPDDEHKEFIHPFKPLIKMNDFRVGEHKIKIPGSGEYLYF
ncbi:MAG: hypothetical protein LBE92_13485 [Chryseobacterium sp.]|jgi:hypothetical protein|uniref:hypothetical protein n=1 Tax=Chryseobacterium sp. TaxID=1871047 RepID=UPI00281DAD93|nr:hypothetical protein [Chryseobacterium sp.]MDR2237128.1 hypothetical protein [Chryseobacterium sp.]